MLSAGPLAFAETVAFHLYALAVQSLWYLPLFCWLLLVSAWSRRAVLLWALLASGQIQMRKVAGHLFGFMGPRRGG